VRTFIRLLLALCSLGAIFACGLPSFANVVIPKAKLAGETVYVRIGQDSASVAAVFKVEPPETADAKVIYFPIFAVGEVDPATVLAQANVDFSINEKPGELVTPCAAPAGLDLKIGRVRTYWFSIAIEDAPDSPPSEGPVLVRLSYSQPLIKGEFLYLPIIPGQTKDEAAWSYQMLARADHHIVRVITEKAEYFPLADAVSIHLRDRQILQLR